MFAWLGIVAVAFTGISDSSLLNSGTGRRAGRIRMQGVVWLCQFALQVHKYRGELADSVNESMAMLVRRAKPV